MGRATVDEHAAHVADLLAAAVQPDAERMPLAAALGRVIAADVHSPVDLPLFRNSQMDGFAVLAADLVDAPVTLPVAGEVAAAPGTPAALVAGTVIRIMTGAPMPDGADAVVPVELATTVGDSVAFDRGARAGEFVRERGSDLAAGDLLVPAGTRLAPRHLAAIAAAGLAHVLVRGRVRVAVITTGSELVPPGASIGPGQLFDSNAIALVAAIESCGGLATTAIHVPDSVELMRASLVAAASDADVIVTSGGISQGAYEVVRETLEPLGAAVGTVAMQPGGPQATGSFEGVPVICFPGNPVSTQVSFEVFLAPLLRAAAGFEPRPRVRRTLTADLGSPAGRRQFLRGRLVGEVEVEPIGGAGSHLVAALAASDCLIVVPEEVTELRAGQSVEAWLL